MTIDERLRQVLSDWVDIHVENVFDEHRLAYIHDDEDTPDAAGRPTRLFVCKCNEAFVRRKFNEHLKDKLKEVQ